MRDKRHFHEIGVQIPDDLEPDNWSIYVICAPTGVQWRTAVHSAIRLMARGRFWKRDSRQRSIKDAQLIGGAIERSLMTCDFTILADAIKYLADNLDVSQNNQQVVNCGGGAGGGGTVLDEPAGQPEDEPVEVVPPVPTAVETSLTEQQKCSLATYLADSWVNNWVDINNYWGGIAVGISTVNTWLQEKFPAGAVLPFIAMVLTSIAVALEAALLAGLASTMADAASAQRDALICAVVKSKTPEQAKRNFESVIADTRAQYGKVPYTVMILVAQMLDWNKIMGGQVIVPASYDTAVCNCTIAEGFDFIPMRIETVLAGNAGSGISEPTFSILDGGRQFDISALANAAGRNFTPAVKVVDPPDRTGLNSRYCGFMFTMNGTNCTLRWNDGPNSDPYRTLWDGGVKQETGQGTVVAVREDTIFPNPWPGANYQYESIGVNVDLCATANRTISLGLQSAAAGGVSASFTGLYWVVKLNDPC